MATPGVQRVLQGLSHQRITARVLVFASLLGPKQLVFLGLASDGCPAEFFKNPFAHK
jgi:hypothetical protein